MTNILFHPALILILGGLLQAALPVSIRRVFLLVLPVIAGFALLSFEPGQYGYIQVFNYELTLLRIDNLSFIFALIFHIALFIVALYAWQEKDTLQLSSMFVYAGGAIGAVLAGDLLTLFIFWEVTAVSSALLIWANRTTGAMRAGQRYFIIHVASGLFLLAGSILHYQTTGSLAFDPIGIDSLAGWLILIAFAIKCAFPLLHNWLQDSYPEASVVGTVALSVFTTKLAVYALARGYPGTDMLIWIGAVMTAYPIFYAVIENDLRRVLSYSLNNQLGFMVVGVGIGTEMALNGAAAHAFSHILYKALLFMSMGAVLHRVGTTKASELGGLYKSMPWTAGFCVIGAMSISAFPLFSGFVSKAMILTAAAEEDHWLIWIVLLVASAGVFHHSGIKIPFFSFFGHDSGKRCAEAPLNMLLAMGIAAILCIAIGVYPAFLYNLLPFDVNFIPYTSSHVIAQLQLLFFSALAFAVLMRNNIYPPELRSTNLDFDWFYRKPGAYIIKSFGNFIAAGETGILSGLKKILFLVSARLHRHHGPQGILARTWPTGSMVMWVAFLLGAYLIFYYIY
ncbi:MAG: Na(+)/H(+) antiporter subunit D [Gammaproteobacteria bacterium]